MIPPSLMLPTLSTEIVAYLALFATVGFLFVFVSLLLGRFLRADAPTVQKLEIYECGEPAVGPGTVQFDLRFYVVALLFLIFEVEVALFFPPAVVFGKAIQARVESRRSADSPATGVATAPARDEDAGISEGQITWSAASSRSVALLALVDMSVFFAVVLVGFAFVWRRGDLDWVRSIRHPATPGETAAWLSRMHRSGY